MEPPNDQLSRNDPEQPFVARGMAPRHAGVPGPEVIGMGDSSLRHTHAPQTEVVERFEAIVGGVLR